MSPELELEVNDRLRDRKVFLSASVPSPTAAQRYRLTADGHLDIQEAVVSLSRAVFAEGGTLVFGGHPAISPLVAMVAGEYITPRVVAGGSREAPIEIYQSRAFEGHLPDETLMMFRAGYATLHWTDAVGGERFDPTLPRHGPRCPLSLRHMRERMIGESSAIAMVCIGGMEGVEEEVEVFLELRQGMPVYVFGETGGAAALLAGKIGHGAPRVIDQEVLTQLAPLRRARDREHNAEALPGREDAERPPVPYPLVAQMLVGELIHRHNHGDHLRR